VFLFLEFDQLLGEMCVAYLEYCAWGVALAPVSAIIPGLAGTR
jgi:hypothetical protein